VSIDFDVTGGVARLTLNRPDKLNAMDWGMYAEITDALIAIESDPLIRVGIITGSGDRAFSAGADLKLMHGPEDVSTEWAPWKAHRWDFGAGTTKPLIAAVNGYALAGGLELALLCDIRIASANATFGTPEVKWDLLHGYGAYRLPQVVGLSNALEMLLTGGFIGAQRALDIGLVSRVVPQEQLMTTATELANTIASNGPTAVRMTKELVQRGLEMPLENYLRLYHMFYERIEGSADQREGLRAFSEGRRPSYGASVDVPATELDSPAGVDV
jgi:enoyl-CoA hydratase/carnithine racemase